MKVYFYKKFCNYYNRISYVNRNNLSQYPQADYISPEVNVNFQDASTLVQIFNIPDVLECDYALVVDDGEINSRWFIIEATRTRKGQYQVKFKRDLLADYYEQVKESPMYVNKAYLQNNDPMIFNSEGVQFNQIKTSEHLLKNENDFP